MNRTTSLDKGNKVIGLTKEKYVKIKAVRIKYNSNTDEKSNA